MNFKNIFNLNIVIYFLKICVTFKPYQKPIYQGIKDIDFEIFVVNNNSYGGSTEMVE